MSHQVGRVPKPSSVPEEAFGTGWRLVVIVCAFLGLSAGYSSTYLYTAGLFLLPVSAHFHVTRGQASLGVLFSTLTAAAAMPLLGRLLDRVTALPVAIFSLLGLAFGFFLLANFSLSFESYIGLSVLLAIFGSGSMGMPFSRLILEAFERRRGIALGVVMTGTGFGALVLPSMVTTIIEGNGWRSAYEWLAILPLASAILLGVALFPVRDQLASQTRRAGQLSLWPAEQDHQPLWRSRPFWVIGCMFLVLAIASVGLVVHFVPILIKSGSTVIGAAKVVGLIGLTSIVGRIIMGFQFDRFPVTRLAIAVVIVAILSAVLLTIDAGWFGVPAALMLGFVMGAEADLIAFYAIRFFPQNCYGSVFGGVLGLYLVGGAIGPALIAFIYDATNGYRTPLLVIVGLFVLALIATCAINALAVHLDREATGLQPTANTIAVERAAGGLSEG